MSRENGQDLAQKATNDCRRILGLNRAETRELEANLETVPVMVLLYLVDLFVTIEGKAEITNQMFIKIAASNSLALVSLHAAAKYFNPQSEDYDPQLGFERMNRAKTAIEDANSAIDTNMGRVESYRKKEAGKISLMELINTIVPLARQLRIVESAASNKPIVYKGVKDVLISGDLGKLTEVLTELFYFLYRIEGGKELTIYTLSAVEDSISLHFDLEGYHMDEETAQQWSQVQKLQSLDNHYSDTAKLWLKAIQTISDHDGTLNFHNSHSKCGFIITFPI